MTARSIATAFAEGTAGYRSTGIDIWYLPEGVVPKAGWFNVGEDRQREVFRVYNAAIREALDRGGRGSCDHDNIVVVLRDASWSPDAPPQFKHRELDDSWNRLVRVPGVGTVLECRDPNSGLGWDADEKPRHQYALVGGLPMKRVLPPESVGDVWLDDPSASHWERFHDSGRWELLRRFIGWAVSPQELVEA